MNALRASGNPSGAAKVASDFTERLDADLGVAPSPSFKTLLASSS
jgi:DNA-binding SARP family transcriptional activator